MANKTVLSNKNILLFSPSFFSYENLIKDAFERVGATVFLYDERSINKQFSKALLKIAPCLFNGKTYKYYKRIVLENINKRIDYILIIRCDMVTTRVLSLLKRSFPNAKLCLHLWDSLKNIKGIKKKLFYFDYISSFDLEDCKTNSSFHFRPLFYSKDFVDKTLSVEYDLCFCGTIHSDRFYILKSLVDQAAKNNLSSYVFAYLPGHFMFLYYKLFGKGFKLAKKSFFSYNKKTILEISQIEKSSNVIIDIQHPKQTGLTMRTIEMIGANKKFITTNKNIVNYDFYNPNNILIIDRKKPILDLGFFKKQYDPLPKHILAKYSIDQWVFDVVGEKRDGTLS